MGSGDGCISSARKGVLGSGVWIAIFLLICASYATQLGLWGDEAFSMARAARSWSGVLADSDAHLPTYYLMLHSLLQLTGAGEEAELTLRLLHAASFSIGLFFCWLIARNFIRRTLLVGLLMLSTIILPNYIFYATNLRMYAPLFGLSMVFCWQVLRLLGKSNWTSPDLILTSLLGLLLIGLDYPGIFLVAPVAAILAIRRWGLPRKPGRFMLWLALLCAVPVFLVLRKGLESYAEWPVLRAMALPEGSPRALAKLLFFSIRPILDIVYPPVYPVWINILLWLLLMVALTISIVALWRRGDACERFLVFLALYWLLAAPLGVSFTRLFLPAQFFALLVMMIGLERALIQKSATVAILLSLTLFSLGLANLQQVFDPTIRVYSRIPFPKVAADAVKLSAETDLDTIAISRHSLNALSIERYLRPRLQAGQQIVILDSKPTCASYPKGEFLYIHLMPEDGESSDPLLSCAGRAEVDYEAIRNYVNLDELGYNSLWESSLKDKTGTTNYGVRIARVNVGPM